MFPEKYLHNPIGNSFSLSAAIYGSFAAIGYLMFGDDTLSQLTLNLPNNTFASKVAIWTTVIVNNDYV